MKTLSLIKSARAVRRLVPVAMASLALCCGVAHAEQRALILSIGNYADPHANLPGIDKDAASARRMAQALGVPAANITELKDRDLTQAGFANAFQQFAQEVQPGDGVFIYYSGHGGQRVANQPGKKCTSGMITHDLKLFEDEQLVRVLGDLSNRAGRVVMMNDSCFSGGAASAKALGGPVAKTFKLGQLSAQDDPDYVCGQADNMKAARNLFVEPRKANMLYIAAASDREVAFAGENGSTATVAWAQCLAAPDANRSGLPNGEDVRACAQNILDRDSGQRRQTITLVGNRQLPVGFAGGNGGQSVNPAATLEAIRASASSSINVDIKAANTQLRINQPGHPGDLLDFTVRTDTAGYLYVLYVGSDGKTFDLLFPNAIDSDNRVAPGSYQLPRSNWAIRAAGPVGTSYVMAVVTQAPRKFASVMDQREGPFAAAPTTRSTARNLEVESTGANQSNPGQFGASRVVAVREVN